MSFTKTLKETWDSLQQSEPGRRFQDRHDRTRQERPSVHWGKVIVGMLLVVPGLIMMPGPGPGAIIVIVGLALMADEFRPLAIFLDRSEVAIRRVLDRLWFKANKRTRISVVATSLLIGSLAIWGGYLLFGDQIRSLLSSMQS